MTQDEKLALDRTVLEGLFGWQDLKKLGQQWLWWGQPPNPKRTGEYAYAWGGFAEDPAKIVPLAEALRARGWEVEIEGTGDPSSKWWVVLCFLEEHGENVLKRIAEPGRNIPEALAKAAARAVGTETKE